jgi:hypothetical protein
MKDFVTRQRQYFQALKIPGQWEDSRWSADFWLETRGHKSRLFPSRFWKLRLLYRILFAILQRHCSLPFTSKSGRNMLH